MYFKSFEFLSLVNAGFWQLALIVCWPFFFWFYCFITQVSNTWLSIVYKSLWMAEGFHLKSINYRMCPLSWMVYVTGVLFDPSLPYLRGGCRALQHWGLSMGPCAIIWSHIATHLVLVGANLFKQLKAVSFLIGSGWNLAGLFFK